MFSSNNASTLDGALNHREKTAQSDEEKTQTGGGVSSGKKRRSKGASSSLTPVKKKLVSKSVGEDSNVSPRAAKADSEPDPPDGEQSETEKDPETLRKMYLEERNQRLKFEVRCRELQLQDLTSRISGGALGTEAASHKVGKDRASLPKDFPKFTGKPGSIDLKNFIEQFETHHQDCSYKLTYSNLVSHTDGQAQQG